MRLTHPGVAFLDRDAPSDIEAGQTLGMATFQLGAGVPDLAAAVDQLLNNESARS